MWNALRVMHGVEIVLAREHARARARSASLRPRAPKSCAEQLAPAARSSSASSNLETLSQPARPDRRPACRSRGWRCAHIRARLRTAPTAALACVEADARDDRVDVLRQIPAARSRCCGPTRSRRPAAPPAPPPTSRAARSRARRSGRQGPRRSRRRRRRGRRSAAGAPGARTIVAAYQLGRRPAALIAVCSRRASSRCAAAHAVQLARSHARLPADRNRCRMPCAS